MIWQSIQYDFPGASLLLFVTPGLAWAFTALYLYREAKLTAFADRHVLASLIVKRQPLAFWMKSVLFCPAWICAVLALMEPKGNEHYLTPKATTPQAPQTVTKRMKTHQVIILLDASASMSVDDTVEGKTRLAVAKEIADNIIGGLKGENVALCAFTSATVQPAPLTTDYLFTRIMLRQVDINEGEMGGTDIKQALETVRRSYFSVPGPALKTLVVLSDGGDTSLLSLEGDAESQKIDEIVAPIDNAEENHLRVFAVGLGSMQGKPVPDVSYEGKPVISALEEKLMRKLALKGRGQFFQVAKSDAWQVSKTITKAIAKEQSYAEEAMTELPGPTKDILLYDYYFQFPLGIAIAALAFILIFPDTRKRRSAISSQAVTE